MTYRFKLTAVALTMATVPIAAQAQEAPQMAVHYDDLDLSSAAGLRTLHKRVEIAIRNVCTTNESRDIQSMTARKACLKAARASVEPQLAEIIARKTRKA